MADRDMIEARQDFITLTMKPLELAALAEKNSQDPQAQSVGRVLNNWELISIGIQANIIDFEVIKRFAKASIIDQWDKAFPFVHALRQRANNKLLYHEFEEMARWLRDDKVPHRVRGDRFWVRRRWVIAAFTALLSFALGVAVANLFHGELPKKISISAEVTGGGAAPRGP